MKLNIGLEDGGLLIKPLIINRVQHMTNAGHLIKLADLKSEKLSFCSVEIDGEKEGKSLEIFCGLLADIIIENLQIRYLINILRLRYFFLSEKTQCELLIKTLKFLWYGKDEQKNDIAICKKDVSDRLYRCIQERDENELILEGFMRFRMKDYLVKWETVLKKNAEEYIIEKEYKEFIGILRYFVFLREPKNITIHISFNESEGYRLSDSQKNEIKEADAKTRDNPLRSRMTREDKVLSTLINISPEKIVVHNSKDITEKRFLSTIKNVFLDRVVFED